MAFGGHPDNGKCKDCGAVIYVPWGKTHECGGKTILPEAVMQITTLNELPVPTLDDMTAGATVVLCGEDHPFDCKRFECVKVVAEQGALVMVTYGWMQAVQPMCELVGGGRIG